MIALILGGCDCQRGPEPDAGGADARRDSGPSLDAGDGGAVADAGDTDEWRCESDGACHPDAPYCCLDSWHEFAGQGCYPEPMMLQEDGFVSCWVYPREPGARPAEGCDAGSPCPNDLPWCCTWLRRQFCSVEALYGWPCVDLAGVPAGPTGQEREDLIRRCAGTEPCPEDHPYCCDDLFCSAEPLHGWSCAVR